MDDELIGAIKLFAGNFAPIGYFTCEGQTLAVNQYTALFAILGTTYGGNGTNTFKLPDLRGAFPTQCTNISGSHPGGTYTLGQVGGLQATPITAANMPPHTHTIVKGSGSNLTGTVSVNTVLQASTGSGANSTPSATNNALGKTVDTSGAGDPNLYTNTAPNQNLIGVTSTVNNTLNFDPTGLQLTPWGSGPAPLPTVPPFVAMQYIICYQGIFPSRP
ncbi:phage tail protein [Flavobacterium praedii]|uniref:phage tail protein n=1 Tax=Flavobacterium praedii TaxID=3002900 RepID=UPI002481B68E|nr:tail fiber protein [Flavobacterium praedii]